jgi:hypothetical protein
MSPEDLANLIAYLNSAPHPLGSSTPEQAQAARRKFFTIQKESPRIVRFTSRDSHPGWLGDLPLASCSPTQGPSHLCWQIAPRSGSVKPDQSYAFGLPVAMGFRGSPGGKFSLRLNSKSVLDFGVALHDQSWQSADGKVQMSYFTMEDSAQESNGILTIAVSPELLQSGELATFEVVSSTPGNKSWFGIYSLEQFDKKHAGSGSD